MDDDAKKIEYKFTADNGSGWVFAIIALLFFLPLHGCNRQMPSLADGVFYKLTGAKTWDDTALANAVEKHTKP